MPNSLDVLQIHASDNICVATRKLDAGTNVKCNGSQFVLQTDVALGAKLALVDLAAGNKVVKFGKPIGTLKADVKMGEYIHTHNLNSDYIPTYDRGELIQQPSA